VLPVPTLAAVSAPPSGWVQYTTQPGGNCRVEGTSNIHDWQVETAILSGQLAMDPRLNFGQAESVAAFGTNLPCNVEVTIPVRSLKSGNRKMDEVMQGALELTHFPSISYRLRQLDFQGQTTNAVLRFRSLGDLVVHGRTNQVSFPVLIEARPDGQLSLTGLTFLRMTEFGIRPPEPRLAMGLIRTGDSIKVSFTWIVKRSGLLADG